MARVTPKVEPRRVVGPTQGDPAVKPSVISPQVQSTDAHGAGPSRQAQALVRDSKPGATFAAPHGTTVRAATLQAWKSDPKDAVADAVASCLPGLARETIVELLDQRCFSSLARLVRRELDEDGSNLPTALWLELLHDASAVHEPSPGVARAAMNLGIYISVIDPTFVAANGKLPSTVSKPSDYVALLERVETGLAPEVAAKSAPYLRMLNALAQAKPREPRGYAAMVAHGRALLPRETVRDLEAVAKAGSAVTPALRTRALAHLRDIHDGLLASSSFSKDAAVALLDAIDYDENVRWIVQHPQGRDAYVTAVRLADGQGFRGLKRLFSSSGLGADASSRAHHAGEHCDLTGDAGAEVLLHEVAGHGAELESNAVFHESVAFMRERAHGEVPIALRDITGDADTFDADEMALAGNVIDPYILKLYPHAEHGEPVATEVTAVGRQAFESPDAMMALLADPEYFYFLLSGLRPNLEKLPSTR